MVKEKKKASSKNKGEIKTFSDKQELRDFVASISSFKDVLKEVLHTETEWHQKITWNHTEKNRVLVNIIDVSNNKIHYDYIFFLSSLNLFKRQLHKTLYIYKLNCFTYYI